MICYLFPEPTYFLFSADVPALLYYAQLPASLISLFISFYIFFKGRKLLLNRLLFVISLLFALWIFGTLIAWTNINGEFISFVWSFFGLILGLISIFSIYFTYVFLEKKDAPLKFKVTLLALLLPILILAPTYLNISGFDVVNCDAFDFEWLPFKMYYTFLGVLSMVWIMILLIKKYRESLSSFRKQIVLMGAGVELFLFFFFGMEALGTFLVRIGILQDSSLELYGLVGMVIFMIYISILMVRFGAFNIKLISTQALVWALTALIGSQFFFIRTTTNFIINGITFVGVIISGYILVVSVKKEIKQRERLEQLRLKLEESNTKLEDANDKLKDLDKMKTEFLSLASHQLRSPLTAIKGYTSMVLEGDYGKMTKGMKEVIERIFQSSLNLSKVVEDLLDVSKIEQGGMKYEMSPFSLVANTKGIVDDLSINADKKGLKLSFESDEESKCMVNGDQTKIRQVILNLIDNSIKYTKEGFVKVSVRRVDDKVHFSVSDTGMGMTEETKKALFQKFSRGEGGKVDASGSGLGLYLSKEIILGHKGHIWVESPGVNKGSTFVFELQAE